MDYPITVNGIEWGETPVWKKKGLTNEAGQMVAVRPCADKFENKTYLGVMLGDIAISMGAFFNKETGILKIDRQMNNPAIFIPDVNEVVFGCGSWWGKIRDVDQLKQITDEDIENVWYVKALRQIEDTANGKVEGERSDSL